MVIVIHEQFKSTIKLCILECYGRLLCMVFFTCYCALTKRKSMYASRKLKTSICWCTLYFIYFLMMVWDLLRLSAEQHNLWKPPCPLFLHYFSNVSLTKSFLIFLPVPGISKQPLSLYCFSCMNTAYTMIIEGFNYFLLNVLAFLSGLQSLSLFLFYTNKV